VRGCEDSHLKLFVCLLQALIQKRSNVETGLNRFLLIGELNFHNYVRLISLYVLDAVHQGLVHVEYYGFRFYLID
jgi:hypothetical protein